MAPADSPQYLASLIVQGREHAKAARVERTRLHSRASLPTSAHQASAAPFRPRGKQAEQMRCRLSKALLQAAGWCAPAPSACLADDAHLCTHKHTPTQPTRLHAQGMAPRRDPRDRPRSCVPFKNLQTTCRLCRQIWRAKRCNSTTVYCTHAPQL